MHSNEGTFLPSVIKRPRLFFSCFNLAATMKSNYKTNRWTFFSISFLVLVLMAGAIGNNFLASGRTTGTLDEAERETLWKEVKDAQENSLPKTAIEKLKLIYEDAMADDDLPEAIKALGMQLMAEGSMEDPAAPHMIRRLEAFVPEAPEKIRPVLKLLLADWHFSYYQQFRWQFAQRDRTSVAPSDDLETWDLPRILSHIDSLYRDALASAEPLKEIPIQQYQDILTKGTVSDAHRPTLYDFVAFQALQFYQLDEQIIRRQGAFDLLADSPIFASNQAFVDWTPETEDEQSYLLQAVKILQELTRFHQDDQDPTALLDTQLQRLEFGKTAGVGSEATARYQAALQRFADAHPDHPLSSRALAKLAESIYQDGDYVKARQIAMTGQARHPESAGGQECQNLVQRIENRELGIQTEATWNTASSSIQIQYRNIDQVHFRLIPFDFASWDDWGNRREPQNFSQEQREAWMKRPPTREWKVDLPGRDDYQPGHHELDASLEGLESGCYLLFASHRPDFPTDNNHLSICSVWVSELAVIEHRDYRSQISRSQVLDAITGEPVAQASVTIDRWVQDGRNSRSESFLETETDQQGFFQFQSPEQYALLRTVIRSGDQQFGMVDNARFYGRRVDNNASYRTVFFTDRSIYRPGQTVQFKGVMLKCLQRENEYQTAADQKLTVVFWDVNGEVIEKRQLQSNQYGSVSGSFTAPADRATGRMRIGVEGSRYNGTSWVNVEEYKRPKFLVEMEKPTTQFQLEQPVELTGTATAYTGAAIDGAKVSWRVVRNVRYPDWWRWRCWYCPPVSGEAQEIAHGETTTGVDGKFTVGFTAVPDRSVDRDSQPIFTYTVYADVTDTTGETRSTTGSVRLGYTSLQANLNVKQSRWLTPETDISIQTSVSTLDGEAQKADGKLNVYRLEQPDQVAQAPLPGLFAYRDQVFSRWSSNQIEIDPQSLTPDLTDIRQWEKGEMVQEVALTIPATGQEDSQLNLPAGAYRVVFETADAAGNPVTSETNFMVIDPNATNLDIKLPNVVRYESISVQPGETFRAIWGTGYQSGRAYVQWFHRGEVVREFWTDEGTTQAELTFDVEEEHRGGFNLVITFVHDNRSYVEQVRVDVPWTNKKLDVKWEHFVSKLTPGQKETWTAIVTDHQEKPAVAEMVATLYDASLDAFSPHSWMQRLTGFYQDYLPVQYEFSNRNLYFQNFSVNWETQYANVAWNYRSLIPELTLASIRYRQTRAFGVGGGGRGAGRGRFAPSDGAMPAADSMVMEAEGMAKQALAVPASAEPGAVENAAGEPTQSTTPDVNLDQVAARKNLQETAFFFPHLVSNQEGQVRIEFEVPEALTEWKLMGLAHDARMRSGYLSDSAVTSKDLMVQPNPPRFLREGDTLQFSVKVSNQSAVTQAGKVRLTFANLRNQESMDSALGNQSPEQEFEIPAGQSESFYWTLQVPDFVGALSYKAVGATERLSDGEEGFLPVLSKRILVTESLPLPIRGEGTKTFRFDSLLNSADSDTIRNQTLTVQMTSNPSWYAVMALPYLMEYPHECSEQVFNRLYANALARHIVNSDDRIAKVFEQWRGTDALDSPLEKNQDLRNVLIEQSPWLRDAKQESQARRDVGILFDNNRLDQELKRAAAKLAQMQMSDGAWPWFPGGRANDYITLYVTTGFGRLRHLGVDLDAMPAIKSLDRLDFWMNNVYQQIVERDALDKNNLTSTICLYLYGRSFFLDDQKIAQDNRPAYDYFVAQAKTYWPKLGSRQSQGHIALALHRIGDRETPAKIVASLTERSKSDEEMGMYWLTPENSWWWYHAPIETQSLMIEVYEEVAADREKVEDLKAWLIKQKQTQNWKTTKATADAVYALLLRGANQLASNQLVTVQLDDQTIQPQTTEAGTGFFQERFVRDEIQPEMGNVTLTKKDPGVAWGSVHWQYLQDIDKIEAYEGTPLTLKKSLYRKKNTQDGPVIEPVTGAVNVGDEIVVRVELRTDRDMEYVHLKDYRGSGTEPVDVLSRYQFQDGLYYYQSTKDTASHFFIDYLPRGTYVFEYSVRVQHRGNYESGIAELQCMYAPEFNSHSGSVTMTVE